MFPSLAELKDLVVVNFSVEGSSLRRAEEQAWVNFADFLDECEEGTTDCSVEDVLIFFTGAAKIPPLGFEKVPSITFQHCPTAKFATSSTCDPELRLPTRHGDDVVAFREAMIMSLMDNDGFGGV